ncbi:MAG: nucleotidyl transferase AbiEii/AbiGii toxin family protein [Treponema sp.]|nr:nucleotidyl transferase AbiEii/AbiGii toxin family protein [Treponema sp.]
MILPSQYYEENLYPLQDGVLNTIARSATDFFLTGGTALSRAYYNHRYSDDLDFFVHKSSNYDEQVDLIFDKLSAAGFFWDTSENFIRNTGFISLNIHWKKSDTVLKLDFVNDLVPHFGDIQSSPLFYQVDNIRNILSNKLSAIFRFANKDIADIREIALHETIDWSQVINEARAKEAGLEIPLICEILTTMPKTEFDKVSWVKKITWETFRADIDKIVYDMMSCA